MTVIVEKMKIEKICVYQVDLPLLDPTYHWPAAGRRATAGFVTTVVGVHTDAGITGYGEVCPAGSGYLPANTSGVVAGIKELGPQLLKEDPLELNQLNDRMDYLFKGHPYVKSPIDMACWDILGKFCNLPLYTLLGGRYGESVNLYRSISQQSPREMREKVLKYKKLGFTNFQLKLGGDEYEDIERFRMTRSILCDTDVLIGDPNTGRYKTGWSCLQAIRIANALNDLDVAIEQPCATYEECLSIRRHTNLPIILDESVDSLQTLMRIHSDNAADIVALKISNFGGLTRIKQARDLCISLGLPMKLEEAWGSNFAASAIAHLALSTPKKFHVFSPGLINNTTVCTADGGPWIEHGKMWPSDLPGLGLLPKYDVLGDPIICIS